MSDHQQPAYQEPGYRSPAVLKSNGVGIAALVVGIVGFVLSCIPFACFAGVGLVAVALILGIVALTLKGRSKGMAIAGTVIAGIGLVIGIFMVALTIAIVGGIRAGVESVNDSLNATHTVVYEVTGTATDVDISYIRFEGDVSQNLDEDGISLPWTLTSTVSGFYIPNVNATSTSGGSLTCRTTVDGVVTAEQTSDGSLAFVACVG